MGLTEYILLIIIVLVGLLVVVASIDSIFKSIKMLRSFKNLFHSGFNLPEGKSIVLKGMLTAIDEPLIAPLSGKPCVYYSSFVEEAKSKNNYNKWLEKTESTPFRITTSMGSFEIENDLEEPDEIDDALNFEFPKFTFYGSSVENLPQEMRNNIRKIGAEIKDSGSLLDPAFDITEEIVPANQEVYVLAKFQYSDDPKILEISPCDNLSSIIISDSQEGIKRNIKNSIWVTLFFTFVGILTPIALGYIIIL